MITTDTNTNNANNAMILNTQKLRGFTHCALYPFVLRLRSHAFNPMVHSVGTQTNHGTYAGMDKHGLYNFDRGNGRRSFCDAAGLKFVQVI